MGKRIIILGLAALMLSIGGAVFAQTMVTLDQAISYSVDEIESRLAQGVKVAVLNFNSPSQRFSNYVLDELIAILARNGKLSVVDKENSEFVLRELNYLRSGNIGDESAQSIGRLLGAQYVISGAIEESSSSYTVQFKTIAVEPAAIQTLIRIGVAKDVQIADLMRTGPSAQTEAGTSFQMPADTSPRTGTDTSPRTAADASSISNTLVLSVGGGGYGRFDLIHAIGGGYSEIETTLGFGGSLFLSADIYSYLLVELSPYYRYYKSIGGSDENLLGFGIDGNFIGAAFSVFGQYPVQLTDRITLSPLLGVGYDMLFYTWDKGYSGAREDNYWDFLYLKPGVKMNYNLAENFSFHAGFTWDYLLYNRLISEIKSMFSIVGGNIFWHGPRIFLGVSYAFFTI